MKFAAIIKFLIMNIGLIKEIIYKILELTKKTKIDKSCLPDDAQRSPKGEGEALRE